MAEQCILAGDIGGTKTNLAIFSTEAGFATPLAEASFASGDYPSLSVMLQEFLGGISHHPAEACFGIAGPVVGGRVKTTNLAWEIAADELEGTSGLTKVQLINDLVAVAMAAPLLDPADLHTIHPGTPEPGGAIGVIAPGTGLGEAFLVKAADRYHAFASEGGHVDFAPGSAQQDRLLAFLRGQLDHVSYEKVCSGRGIPLLYSFLKNEGLDEPDWLAERLSGRPDPTPTIIGVAMDQQQTCPLCQQTLKLFIDILAAEAGNLALKVMATGGIYLGGGIPPRIIPALNSTRFTEIFEGKGRLAPLLARIPVHTILNPKAALFGAAACAIGKN